jgi:hypothetical protein
LRETSWDYVFYVSAAIIALNFVLVLFFYKEPDREPNELSLQKSIAQALKNIFIALKDFRFFLFLLIIVGFWSMYFQLFYTLPVFIDQWVNTRGLYDWLFELSPRLAGIFGTAQGTVNPEMILNLDALYIVIFQVVVSGVVMRMRPISAMIVGIVIASIGIGLTFMFNNPFFLFFSILIFAFGEMASSPKITEYIGRIAPKDKLGLYMGCSFLPMSGGNFLAGILSGPVYADWADKLQLLRRDLDAKGIEMPVLSEQFTQNDLFLETARQYDMTIHELTNYLWQTYQPGNIWYLFTGIGLGTALLLWIFDRLLMRKKSA